ncbi:hypothetical protein DRO91_09405 [Candidatus Heimdallarchaeota archaeon]|nr:MAG: hypothetical protein DRO91_09405 [Candidatus Heimdallarchaeota archaeon]
MSANTWYHVVLTFKRSDTAYMYFNTTQVGNGTTQNYPLYGGTSKFYIGRRERDSTYPLNGAVDMFGMWSRILTSAEIAQLYNSGNGLDYPFGGTPTTVEAGWLIH